MISHYDKSAGRASRPGIRIFANVRSDEVISAAPELPKLAEKRARGQAETQQTQLAYARVREEAQGNACGAGARFA
jgi:hypothetical protein